MTLISRTIVVKDNGCIGFDQFLVGWMILTSVICMFAPGGKPRYRLKMAHLYTPAGAMGQGWKNQESSTDGWSLDAHLAIERPKS